MIKKLRSLILENFPFELRVDLELLSRRRDIRNKDKQDELFTILRKHKVQNLVPLGSGTNRYAFKMNGYVIKFATDQDGKIDNMKEFKMAKRLWPNVIQVHEISANGCLLVCEYIQPFDTFAQMLEHKEEIRAILNRLSSVYLIGDVGISDKNFRNWGVRIGTNKPVCLDFAYVYDVKSKLFVCYSCGTNSVILPNQNFTELYCSNPNCNKRYLFEDIRRKISQEGHQKEIGDLREEAYSVFESNIPVELDLQRSQYLKKYEEKNEKIEKNIKPVEEIDHFCMDWNQFKNKGE